MAITAVQVTVGLPAIRPNLHRQKRDFVRREDKVKRIINGEAASDELTFIAYIESYNQEIGWTSCAGNLIAENVIVTSNKCVYILPTVQFTAEQIQVEFIHNTTEYLDFRGTDVAEIIVHPDFNYQTWENDVVVLMLNKTIPTSEGTLAKIYTGEYNMDVSPIVAGYGIVHDKDGNEYSDVLLQANFKIGTTEYCKVNMDYFNPEFQICTDDSTGYSACYEDNGGPMIVPVDNPDVKCALLGHSSFWNQDKNTNPKGICELPGGTSYFTRLGPYADWIAKVSGLETINFTISNVTAAPIEQKVSPVVKCKKKANA
ncbi:trypsin-like cysteine/serine peptidase domain-containing protein [Kickxella alabastrina]|uniref:trypsin-like cysteine/serine peptidase domain-containing protein n=1 Tax=Kickxella alabastrina TaxID=61397 RepID=UPI00221EBC21|nr:trypsin-like cysteine/serine peptidase domain-containing protein [Kickxella alabastrina]KAI7829946.1 trypsin-like cysteine/serine peptidase domain-containing protein [Kickxella alabastrina]